MTTTPFDKIAPAYAALWSDTANGRAQREQVWQTIDRWFAPGQRVLDLGCGTGDDALHLAARAVVVHAIDASEPMVNEALLRGVNARPLTIEAISTLPGPFEGALSNFGALNCVADLPGVAVNLARLVTPGGHAAICVLSRFYWREWFTHPSRAWKRLRGETLWRGLRIYYRSGAEVRSAFAPHFVCVERQSIGGGDHLLLVFRRCA